MEKPYEEPRYVGFVDLLGYKSIALGDTLSDPERYSYLISIFKNLAGCALGIPQSFPDLRDVQFSDSFYFSSRSALTIVAAMAKFFGDVFGFYSEVFSEPPPDGQAFREWLPFLRGAIVNGWMFEGFDITLPSLQNPTDSFRNPIGPAIAAAYVLSENSGVEGMRLVVSRPTSEGFTRELQQAPPSVARDVWSKLAPLPFEPESQRGQMYEVPWFECCLSSGVTPRTFDHLIDAERQFGFESMKHYRGTWDSILRAPGMTDEPELQRLATAQRFEVVRRMAWLSWQKRGCPVGDDWYDWLVAEGKVSAKKCA